MDVYNGEKTLKFEIIRDICDYYSIPTRMFFEEKNMNLKDNDMAKKKVKKIIPGIPDSELDPPIVSPGVEEGGGYPRIQITCKTEIFASAEDEETKKEDPVKKVVDKKTYDDYKSFFDDCKRLAASLEMDNKSKDEVKQEIFNLVCGKMISKNGTFDMKKVHPYYLKIVEAILAS